MYFMFSTAKESCQFSYYFEQILQHEPVIFIVVLQLPAYIMKKVYSYCYYLASQSDTPRSQRCRDRRNINVESRRADSLELLFSMVGFYRTPEIIQFLNQDALTKPKNISITVPSFNKELASLSMADRNDGCLFCLRNKTTLSRRAQSAFVIVRRNGEAMW